MRARVLYRAVGLGAAMVAAGYLIHQLITLLLAVVLTVIISLPLSAAADLCQRHHLPRGLGAAVALLAVLGGIALLGYFIIPAFVDQVRQFANTLPHTLSEAERYIHHVTGVTKHSLSTKITNFVQGYTHHPQRLISPLESVGLSIAAIVAGLVVVLITALYIAINPEPLLSGALKLLPLEHRPRARQVMRRIRGSWLGWLQAMVLDMLVLGGLLYGGMRLVGLPFAVGFAVFSALLTVIPNYGSIISAIPPVLLGLSLSPGKALLVLGVYVVVNQIEGNLIYPLIMARRVELHPALVTIGVLVMAQLFGLIGILISIPLISLTIILVDELWIAPMERAAAPEIAKSVPVAPPSGA
jgi:predicted PurR-regulated permease PerM